MSTSTTLSIDKTLEKATKVVEAAAVDLALEPVVAEMDRTGKVDPAYTKTRKTMAPTSDKRTPAEKAASTRWRKRVEEVRAAWLENPKANEKARRALIEVVALREVLEDLLFSIGILGIPDAPPVEASPAPDCADRDDRP